MARISRMSVSAELRSGSPYADSTSSRPRIFLERLAHVQPFFSPDGQWIGFFAENALQKIAVSSGLPTRICDVPGISLGGAWGADGTIVFAVFESGLFKIAASGGTPHPFWTGAGAWPEILPDGRTVLFTSGGRDIVTIDLAGGNRRTLASRGDTASPPDGAVRLGTAFIKEARDLPTGHLVYGEDPGSIRAVPFDVPSLTLQGAPVTLVDGVYTGSNGGATYFAVSKTGLLAYAREIRQRQLEWGRSKRTRHANHRRPRAVSLSGAVPGRQTRRGRYRFRIAALGHLDLRRRTSHENTVDDGKAQSRPCLDA